MAAALLLAGCSLGPRYERPALDVPPGFRATADSAAAAWPADDWWRNFHSPELDDLIARARAYNSDLAAAAARVIQADAQVRISGAPLLPTVGASGDFNYQRSGTGGRSRSSISGFSTGNGYYTDSRSYSVGLQVSYDLDLFGRNRAQAEAAGASAIATRFDQETVALAVVTSVASTYFQVLSGQDRLRVAQRNLRDAERILGAYRARLAAGTANALDVSQQEALVAGQRAAIPNLQNAIEQQRIALGILVGQPPERLDVGGGSLDKLPLPMVSPGLPSELLARRPDVASAEAQLVAENANIRAARAAFFPDVTLTASGGLTSAALTAITGPGTLVAQLAASLTQTIFDNGLRRGQLDLTKGRYAELVANYRKATLQAFTDVEQALTALRYTGEQETLERAAIAVAQRSADIAQAQLQAGTIDIITSLNTQQTLFNDLDLLTQIRLSRFQALLNLYKALGRWLVDDEPAMKRLLILLVLLAAAGGGGYWWYSHRATTEQTAAAPGGAGGGGRRRGAADPSTPTPVLAATSESRDVPIYLDGLGTVQAFNLVSVRAMIDGPLIEVRFREGQDVKAGDVLALIDPRPYQATLDSATAKKQQDEANLANAKLDAARYAKLAATAYSSAQQSDTARAQVAQLEAQVRGDQAQIDTAKTQLSYATITAPIDGRIGLRQVDRGNIVHSGDTAPLTVLTQLKPISVVFTLPQQALPQVASAMQDGMPEVLAVRQGGAGGAVSDPIDRGTLAVLDNQVDPNTGTIKLKATFPNADLKLWPGGFVNVRMLVETQRKVVTVPTAAVQRGPRGTYVYVVQPGNTAQRRPVKVGHEDDQLSIVAEGIKPGEQVVIDGAQRLTDGAKVAVAGPDGNAPDAIPARERSAPGTAQRSRPRSSS